VASRPARHVFEGTGAFPWIGLGFLVVSVLFLMSILLTPDGWQWWLNAKTVHGSEQDGIVYYTYGGTNYAVNDPDSLGTGPRVVYLISSKPWAGALTDTGNRVLDWTVTGGPVLVATGFVAWGFRRRSHINRRRTDANHPEATFGEGLDSGVVRRLIAEQNSGSVVKRRQP
jgi:hypothetical protein